MKKHTSYTLTRETGDKTFKSLSSLKGLMGGLHTAEELLLAALLAISFALNALTLSSLHSDNALFVELGVESDTDEWVGVIA